MFSLDHLWLTGNQSVNGMNEGELITAEIILEETHWQICLGEVVKGSIINGEKGVKLRIAKEENAHWLV